MGKLELFYEETKPLLLKKSTIKKHLNYLVKSELCVLGEINIIFCTDDYLLEINKQYLDHDYYTDIITFDYVEGKRVSGDLFISVDRVKDNAVKFTTEFKKELVRVIFHGVLHLCGYKDKKEDDKKLMGEKENFYLSEVDLSEFEI